MSGRVFDLHSAEAAVKTHPVPFVRLAVEAKV